MMKCPYCVSELNSQALVCPICKRDIALPVQLLSHISDLEEQLFALRTDQQRQAESDSLPVSNQTPEKILSSFEKYRNFIFDFAKFFVLPLCLLILAHIFITIIYDTKILYLRLVTLILPIFFGYFLYHTQTRRTLAWIICALALGWLSVVGMSTVTSHVDGSPIWPQTIYVWRDLIEFAASISFSYITGMLLGRLSFLKSSNLTNSATVNQRPSGRWLIDKEDERVQSASLQIIAKKINELTATIGAIVTTIVAIYTGLKGLF